MIVTIGTTFPPNWQYGLEETGIFASTRRQIAQCFSNQKNLLINTTWFGPQFDNDGWAAVQQLIAQGETFDNLFLLAVIDPEYITSYHLREMQRELQIKHIFRIGMYENSKYEWNFHAWVVQQNCIPYSDQDIVPDHLDRAFLLYQRKPRPHRIHITQQLIKEGILDRGIVTLGSNQNHNHDWTEGNSVPLVLTIDDKPEDYLHNGSPEEFSGIPNDLVSLGRLDIWRRCFLNVVSETEFAANRPRFVTEKTWKPIIGLRPFLIHGQTKIYSWLRQNGFRTFNHYWSHIDVEGSSNVHETTVAVLKWLSEKTPQQLLELYNDMLPDLQHNKARYQDFAQEQYHKMHHLFS